jgi:cytochrome o ubiquinol oxidase subunit 2
MRDLRGSVRTTVPLLALLLSGCSGVLNPRGPIGNADRTILLDCVLVMLVIVVPTIVATLAFAWWFRASNARAKRHLGFVYSGQIELLVWSVPVLVVLLLAGVTWIGTHELDPAKPLTSSAKPLEVQVVSLDWKWLFIYPGQGVASVNDLTIPAGVPVHFSLTSASVMNAFFVPQLGSMIYTMSGMVTQLNLRADRPGDFWGQSSHFSGDGFAGMHFEVHAVTADQFTGWISRAKQTGSMLDTGSYAVLARQSLNVRPLIYSSVQPTLFHDITTLKLSPGPGPGPANAASSGTGY